MKLSELVDEVRDDMRQDKVDLAKAVIKERLLELESLEETVAEAKRQLKDLLEEDL